MIGDELVLASHDIALDFLAAVVFASRKVGPLPAPCAPEIGLLYSIRQSAVCSTKSDAYDCHASEGE